LINGEHVVAKTFNGNTVTGRVPSRDAPFGVRNLWVRRGKEEMR
jgi:hypothetical protein